MIDLEDAQYIQRENETVRTRENAIIGAVSLYPKMINFVIGKLSKECFYFDNNSLCFELFEEMNKRGERIDLLTITAFINANYEKYKAIANPATFPVKQQRITNPDHLENWILNQLEYHYKRNIQKLITSNYDEVIKGQFDSFVMFDRLQGDLNKSVQVNVRQEHDLSYHLHDTLGDLAERMERDKAGEIVGHSSGCCYYDETAGSWEKGHLVILAARPAMGKTTFSLYQLRQIAGILDENEYVAYFSLEMSTKDILRNMLSSESQVEAKKLKKGSISEIEHIKVQNAASEIAQLNIHIDDDPILNPLKLKAKLQKLISEGKILKYVFIDYLQLLSDEGIQGNNRTEKVTAITRLLKLIAKELDIVIICLCQLNRAAESRGDKRPELSDLRESGSIEQDADVVIMLYRPEYYGIMEDETGSPTYGLLEVLIKKNRFGEAPLTLKYHIEFRFFNTQPLAA